LWLRLSKSKSNLCGHATLVNKSDNELRELVNAWDGVSTIESEALKKVVAAIELLRRWVNELTESSRRLECLTKGADWADRCVGVPDARFG